MQLHEIKRVTPQKTEKRIGRGGKRGKMSGRGHKGQTARAGNSTRPEMRDIIKKYPKLRGHGKNRADTVNAEKVRPVVINLGRLDAAFSANAVVTPGALIGAGLIAKASKRVPKVKILATGTLTKALKFEGFTLSEAAIVKIKAAGGTVQ